ncbi:MAG TPA: hypothetical protein VIR30_05455 [Nocardioides sp.]
MTRRVLLEATGTTAAGRPYMVTRTPFGNDDAVITQPATLASGDSTRGVLFFHGAGSNHLDMALSAKWRPTRDAVIDAGGILVECRGNGFSDVGDETGTRNWGREWSRDAYRAAAEIAEERFAVRSWITLSRSMGGVNGKYFATRDELVAPKLDGHIDNAAIYSLINCFDRQKFSLHSTFRSGLDRDGFMAATRALDPARQDPALWQGRKVLVVVGDADTTVERADHGSQFWIDHQGVLDIAGSTHYVMRGKGHGSVRGTFETVAMANFIKTCWQKPRVTARHKGSAQVRALFDVGVDGTLVQVHSVGR